jgi:hypothetical protein
MHLPLFNSYLLILFQHAQQEGNYLNLITSLRREIALLRHDININPNETVKPIIENKWITKAVTKESKEAEQKEIRISLDRQKKVSYVPFYFMNVENIFRRIKSLLRN